MLPIIAGQTAGPIGLKFFVNTRNYFLNFFSASSIFNLNPNYENKLQYKNY